MIWGVLAKIKAAAPYLLALIVATVGVGGVYIWNQWRDSVKNIERLEAEIAALEEAVRLTESLRNANAELTRQLNHVEKDLSDAEGSDQPLPDDIGRIVRGVRDRVISSGISLTTSSRPSRNTIENWNP